MAMKEQILVTVDELKGWFDDPNLRPHLRIVDCRWVLGEAGAGRRQYETGHIPGAVHLDVDEHLSGKEGPGRHPLPGKREFGQLLGSIGIDRESSVVVYDAGTGAPAARLWWLLRYYGHENVGVLDGGWKVWVEKGGAVSTEVPAFSKTDTVLRPKRRWVTDKSTVDSLRDQPDAVLIDARSPERYRGETEPIDARAGHIPGAVNLPYSETIDPETGLFKSPEELKQLFVERGVSGKKVISYCGSGITACTNLLALKIAGFDGVLYEGSWSDWSADQNLQIAGGQQKSGS